MKFLICIYNVMGNIYKPDVLLLAVILKIFHGIAFCHAEFIHKDAFGPVNDLPVA